VSWYKKSAKAKLKSRSGTTWTDADYAAAGYGRIGLRLPNDELELLDVLARFTGANRSQVITNSLRKMATRVGVKWDGKHWVPPVGPVEIIAALNAQFLRSPPIDLSKSHSIQTPTRKPRYPKTTGRIR
jgi:hypothetical protein